MKNKFWLVPLGLALLACSPGVEPEPETKVLTAQTLYFDGFNSNEANLETQGFRVYGPGADLAADVEPEYITVDAASGKAWVTLQENNGIAEITLGAAPEIAALRPLGLKDYSTGNRLDANDKDLTSGSAQRASWANLYGLYQPDGLDSFVSGGKTYLITANEGDAREWGTFVEEARVSALDLDDTAFPTEADLKTNSQIGRLNVTNRPFGPDALVTFNKLYTYGGRSFTIWDADDGSLVWDSGEDTEDRAVAAGLYDDGRSDNKGTEPEAAVVGEAGGKMMAFIGLERSKGVLVYDITDVNDVKFLQVLTRTGDLNPEGLLFIDAEDSPNEKSMVVVSNEVSGTVTIYGWQDTSFALLGYLTLTGGEGAAEISAYDPGSKRLFVVNNALTSTVKTIDVIDLAAPAAPVYITSIDIADFGAAVNSVACHGGLLAAAIEASPKTDAGKAVVWKAATLELKGSVTTGALPDMITFSPDGKYILTANEGEPSSDYTVDPKGSVTVITVPAGF